VKLDWEWGLESHPENLQQYFHIAITAVATVRIGKVKVKLSLQQAVKAHRSVGRRGSHIF
jgi:hypothetical protein